MNKLTIALIDDDYLDRLISKKLLARISPEIRMLEFSNATDALQYLTDHAGKEDELPDLVILDIRMPAMSGWDYLKHYSKLKFDLRKQPKHFIYTSSIDPEDLNHQHENIHGLFTKPFENDSLLQIIEAGMREE